MIRSTYRLRIAAALLLLGSGVFTALGEDPPANRDRQIAELEKQLAEVRARLDELKADKPKSGADKKPLSLADADSWRSIRGAVVSADGKWFAHRVGPAEGDGEVILREIASDKETKFPAGAGFGQLSFAADSKWLAFSVTPYVKPGASPAASAAPRPKPKVVLVNLATAAKSEFEGIVSFQFSGESATHLALRKASVATRSLPLGVAAAPSASPPAADGPTGSDLVLRNLAAGTDLLFGNVTEYAFDKKGAWMVMLTETAGQLGNGVVLLDLKSGALHPLDSAQATYRGLAWDDDGVAFTVLKGIEDKGFEGKWHSILGYTDLGPKPTCFAYDPKDDKDFPKEMAIAPSSRVSWTDARDAFVFGIAERKKKDEPKRDSPGGAADGKDSPTAKAKSLPAGKKDEPKVDPPLQKAGGLGAAAKPDLVLWHWRDERLQSMQEKQATADKQFTYTCLYRVHDKKFLRLADSSVRQVTLAPKQRFAIGRDVKPYEYMSNLDGRRFSDTYVINLATGERRKALTRARYVFTASPAGTHLLYYDDGHYYVHDLAAGSNLNITKGITETTFVDTENDHNVDKPPVSPVGWSRDGRSVLLSDGWDIWQVKADGSGGSNLTQNGKRDGIRYRNVMQFEPEPKPGIDLTKAAYVALYEEWTKKSGLCRLDPGQPGTTILLCSDCLYGMPQKARQADVFAFTRQTCQDYPDYYLTDAQFKNHKQVTAANPQQADYKWTAGSRLIDYNALGQRLQAALFLPANYEPGKKYPTIVQIYEKLSDGLHRYQPPSTRMISGIYTSNGYAVLMPDITYTVNDPGRSSVKCILAALDAAVASGVVDNDRVALTGHSWGGYQTAFAVTQTKRFKCAIAGAPLTDLISMYSSIYWNTGSANQPIFESSQGRFTGGYWEQQEAYIRNSPVHFAKEVQTPILLLHNDKDGAVEFTQGIEYYNTLRRLQKPVVLLQYKGENHSLVKPENVKDYAMRTREFFDHYLLDKPAPDWWSEGVQYLKMDDHLKNRKP